MKAKHLVNAPADGRGRGQWVYGVHAVRAHIERRPSRVIRVLVLPGLDGRRRALAELATAAGVEVGLAPADDLAARCGSEQHQGVVALLREFQYAELGEVAAGKPLVLVAADGVEDPRNLGALIRSIAAAGTGGLIMPKDRAAPITSTVEKAASGVTAWFPIVRVTNLVRALTDLKRRHGYWVIGLEHGAESVLFDTELPGPAVLVVGGETGLREGTKKACDLHVRIPMAAGVESLNVAVAAAVAAFELGRRGRE